MTSPYDEDRPEQFPVYEASARLGMPGSGETVFCGLKATGLDIQFADGWALHYDLEGRLVRAADPPRQWRRGLSHRTVFLLRETTDRGSRFRTRLLNDRETDTLLDATSGRVRSVVEARSAALQGTDEQSQIAGNDALEDVLHAASRFDAAAAHRDRTVFRSVYGDVPILPPDQYNSLPLMATDGCPYNQCTFCGFYRGTRFRRRSAEEFAEHVAQAVAYHGRGLAARRSIFLGQANALLGDPCWGESILRVVGERFELPDANQHRVPPDWWRGSVRRFNGATSFLDAFSGTRINAAEFARLRDLNLRTVYIGMETGDAALLRWLQKPATPERIVETVRAARQGGIHAGIIVLIGAGGEPFFEQHVRETVRCIRAMQLARGDYVYLSPLRDLPGSEYARIAKSDGIQPLTLSRMADQERQVRTGLGTSRARGGPYVARYDVGQFVY